MSTTITLDLDILKIVRSRENYDRLKSYLSSSVMGDEAFSLFSLIRSYYETFQDVQELDIDSLTAWSTAHGKAEVSKAQSMVMDTLKKCSPLSPEYTSSIIEGIILRQLEHNLKKLLLEFESGKEIDLLANARMLTDTTASHLGVVHKAPWIQDSLESILDEQDKSGLSFRLPALNRHTRGVRPGDFIILAARPDRGKTSFCASELVHLGSQLPEDRPVLWLSNEGIARNHIPRLYQTAINCDHQGLRDRITAGTVHDDYVSMVGHKDKVRVCDITDWSAGDIENVVKEVTPGVILFDMLDNVKWQTGGTGRQDLDLENLYQWARIIAAKYECIVIATSQVSGDGEGEAILNMNQLKDSKTGKQGTADLIIMLGSTNNEGQENVRWLNLPKNKLKQSGVSGNPRCEFWFEPDTCQFVDPEDMENHLK